MENKDISQLYALAISNKLKQTCALIGLESMLQPDSRMNNQMIEPNNVINNVMEAGKVVQSDVHGLGIVLISENNVNLPSATLYVDNENINQFTLVVKNKSVSVNGQVYHPDCGINNQGLVFTLTLNKLSPGNIDNQIDEYLNVIINIAIIMANSINSPEMLISDGVFGKVFTRPYIEIKELSGCNFYQIVTNIKDQKEPSPFSPESVNTHLTEFETEFESEGDNTLITVSLFIKGIKQHCRWDSCSNKTKSTLRATFKYRFAALADQSISDAYQITRRLCNIHRDASYRGEYFGSYFERAVSAIEFLVATESIDYYDDQCLEVFESKLKEHGLAKFSDILEGKGTGDFYNMFSELEGTARVCLYVMFAISKIVTKYMLNERNVNE